MNKAELIDAIASDANLSKADSKRALEGFIAATADALKKGDRVALVGFGSFSVARRTPPGSCEPQNIPEFEYDPDTGSCSDGRSCESCSTDDAGIADEMSARTKIDPATAALVLDIIKSEILAELFESNQAVRIKGLGAFGVFVEAEITRRARNPQTGKEIKVAAKKIVKFKAGADLSKKVN